MPLASYDYDYYEYINGHRTNKTTYATQTASKRTTSQTRKTTTSSQNRRSTSTTKTQPRSTTTTRKTNVNSTAKRPTSVTNKKATTKKNAPRTTTRNKTTQKKKYDIDIPIRTSSRIANKPKEMTLKKPKAKVNPVTALKEALVRTFGIAIFFAIAFAICYRYSLINEEFIALRNVKKEYENIQNVNEQIEADIESKTDLTYIENYAKYQLGMQKPSDAQIRYVNIEKKDRVLTPVTIEEKADTNWFTSLCEEIGKILD